MSCEDDKKESMEVVMTVSVSVLPDEALDMGGFREKVLESYLLTIGLWIVWSFQLNGPTVVLWFRGWNARRTNIWNITTLAIISEIGVAASSRSPTFSLSVAFISTTGECSLEERKRAPFSTS
ncbi:hypothetical protein BT69DRAFT_1315475 [Atractiella rhizophila]|nr:hypothetical protein BT69DRAFT_1315475 [Atractiella rhizophila]